MSQATPPEGTAPDEQPLDDSSPLEAGATQPPAGDDVAGEPPAGTDVPPDNATPNDGPPEEAEVEAIEGSEDNGADLGHADDDGGEPADAPVAAEEAHAEVEEGNGEAAEAAPAERPRPARPTVIARYGAMRSIGEFRHNSATPLPRGTKLVIRTERGVEFGEVVVPVCAECDGLHLTSERLKEFIRENGSEYPFRRDGRVLRLANPQDVIDYRHLQQSAREAATYCRQEIRAMSLGMKLVAVEHLLGGERLVFFFAAEHRVDFRDLVRKLASQYRTRIEMRQVGARDEARLVADYERCGQQCCCQSFLKDLRPVSMRMAKTQKATLDPSKISGRCGRLMCCLRYEDTTYEHLRKKLPRKNTWVRTADDVIGRVVGTQIITQLVKIQLTDYTFKAVGNEDIVERGLTAPPTPEAPVAKATRRSERPIRRKRERLGAAAEAEAEAQRGQAVPPSGDLAEVGATDTGAGDDATALDGADLQPAAGAAEDAGRPDTDTDASKKRRRRRRRKKGAKDLSQAAGGSQATAESQRPGDQRGGGPKGGTDSDAAGGDSTTRSDNQSGDRKPRRRRRRRKKGPDNRNRPAGKAPPA